MSILNSLESSFDFVIDTLGSPASLHIAKSGATIAIPKVGITSVDKKDTALIEAYGVSGFVITIKAKDVPGKPEKFDKITMAGSGAVYVFDDVKPKLLGDKVVGWSAYTKGK